MPRRKFYGQEILKYLPLKTTQPGENGFLPRHTEQFSKALHRCSWQHVVRRTLDTILTCQKLEQRFLHRCGIGDARGNGMHHLHRRRWIETPCFNRASQCEQKLFGSSGRHNNATVDNMQRKLSRSPPRMKDFGNEPFGERAISNEPKSVGTGTEKKKNVKIPLQVNTTANTTNIDATTPTTSKP
jgi:hypothetical protein